MTFWDYLDRRGERMAAMVREPNIRILANVIGCSVVFGFLGALFALFVIPVPKGNEQIVTYMIGQLSGFAAGIIAYHYSSKAGEKELDAKRVDNTAKFADAVTALAGTGTGEPTVPQKVEVVNKPSKPVPVDPKP